MRGYAINAPMCGYGRSLDEALEEVEAVEASSDAATSARRRKFERCWFKEQVVARPKNMILDDGSVHMGDNFY